MNICFIANKYPNRREPNVLVFVQQLVWELADMGHDLSVISPIPINLHPSYVNMPRHCIEATENGARVDVYRPKCFGLGQSHYVFGRSPIAVTTKGIERSSNCVIAKMLTKPDAIIGHFAAPAGVAAVRLAKKWNSSGYVSFGDYSTIFIDQFGRDRIARVYEDATGVIAASTRNRDMLCEAGVIDADKVRVFPNGYRAERFFPHDRSESRKHFGFPQDAFIAAYVGTFDERKGIRRLEKAIDPLQNVYYACAGSGPLAPANERCLFMEHIPHSDLPLFYSAADIFVLPTLEEGCCNAIVEAMACGLPVVSSDRGFNYDTLDETCSILIDPENSEELSHAIDRLYTDKAYRSALRKGSLRKAEGLTLSARAKNIASFLTETANAQ